MKFVDAFQQFGHILFIIMLKLQCGIFPFLTIKLMRLCSPFPEDVEQAKIFTSDYENLSSQKEKIVKENRDKFLRPKKIMVFTYHSLLGSLFVQIKN